MVSPVSQLEKALGMEFRDRPLLQQAVTHTSYFNENPGCIAGHNERLEFLGDAVLDFIVAEKLYRDNPELPEGEMSQRRAALVRRETLARVADTINLGDYLLLGKGEEASGGRKKIANIAGALEAVIAAVYLEAGLETVRKVVESLLKNEWNRAGRKGGPGVDYKSRLQELCQARFQTIPVYRITGESGPDHDKSFTVELAINDKIYGSATGKSKKLAETEVARLALAVLEEQS